MDDAPADEQRPWAEWAPAVAALRDGLRRLPGWRQAGGWSVGRVDGGAGVARCRITDGRRARTLTAVGPDPAAAGRHVAAQVRRLADPAAADGPLLGRRLL